MRRLAIIMAAVFGLVGRAGAQDVEIPAPPLPTRAPQTPTLRAAEPAKQGDVAPSGTIPAWRVVVRDGAPEPVKQADSAPSYTTPSRTTVRDGLIQHAGMSGPQVQTPVAHTLEMPATLPAPEPAKVHMTPAARSALLEHSDMSATHAQGPAAVEQSSSGTHCGNGRRRAPLQCLGDWLSYRPSR